MWAALALRELITKLLDRLPDHFIRIRRSFVITRTEVQSQNTTEVVIGAISPPIARTHKAQAIEALESRNSKYLVLHFLAGY